MAQEPGEQLARHARGSHRSTGQIAWSFIKRFKWLYLPMLLSPYGREIVKRKYDAIATDMAYENRPSWQLGPVSYIADRFVLNLPTHAALRQRLEFVVEELRLACQAAAERCPEGDIRLLSAPCGGGRDITTFGRHLKESDTGLLGRAEFHALDLDPTGEALPLLERRAAEAGIVVTARRQDMFTVARDEVDSSERFDVVNCIGLTPWLTIDEVSAVARLFHSLMRDGSTLLIDWFGWHRLSKLAYDLEINTVYHERDEFISTVEKTGFSLERHRETSNHVNTVFVFTRS